MGAGGVVGGGWEVWWVGDGWCGGWEGDGRCGGWDNTHRTAVSASISVEGPLSGVGAPLCELGDDGTEGGAEESGAACTHSQFLEGCSADSSVVLAHVSLLAFSHRYVQEPPWIDDAIRNYLPLYSTQLVCYEFI